MHFCHRHVDMIFVLHYYGVMKNVTITLDPEVARWAKIHAARHDVSLSRMVARMLEREMVAESNYEAAMRHYLSQQPVRLKSGGERYPNREDLHGR